MSDVKRYALYGGHIRWIEDIPRFSILKMYVRDKDYQILQQKLSDSIQRENELEQKLEESEGRVAAIIKAWESLPEGDHKLKVIQNWITEDMLPAINSLRKSLKPEGG